MKYILICIGLLFLTSCQKDYTCSCTINSAGQTFYYTYHVGKMTYKSAKNECAKYETTNMHLTQTCKLD